MARILDCNARTERFGLSLTEEEARSLIASRRQSLAESRRVEFGPSILPELIFTFCDSQYITQEDYGETMEKLQEAFFMFKNETMDDVTDGELLDFMKYEFDGICCGDVDYLRGTCLERFSRAVRAGESFGTQKRLRDEYSMGNTGNGYERLEEEARWDFGIYRMGLEDD